MSILLKAATFSKQPLFYQVRRGIPATRFAMSTISDAIKKDHREINEYADNIRQAQDDDTRTRWQNQLTWELARHSIGEELVVYPAFAKHLGERGQQMADKDRAEHQTVCLDTFSTKL